MTALLEDKVYALVLDKPNQTTDQIAMTLRARRASVERILKFSGMFEHSVGANRARVWRVASRATGRPRTAAKPSQAQRMADLLADGQWHSDAELWDIGVGRPNSRAAELRSRGFMVEHRREASEVLPSRAHQYRITSRPVEAATGSFDSLPSPGPVAASSGRGRADGEPPVAAAAPEPSGQLTLVGGAFTRSAAA